ncbi:MAG: GNAT family N-acetyltransferase [Pseudomonadota bacterium]
MTALTSIPTIETDRLVLRAPAAHDVAPFVAFFKSKASTGVGGPLPEYETWRYLAQVLGHWHLRGFGRWIVTTQDADAAIGLIGLHAPLEWPEPEVGWMLWDRNGQGLATEAATAARAYAYGTLGFKTLVSCIVENNPASRAVAQRLGAKRDAEDFVHPKYGTIQVWRHPSPEALA